MKACPDETPAAAAVSRLLNLHDGSQAIANIVAIGDQAISLLEAVLRGPSQALHHSRCWAADSLAKIGGPNATYALLRALRDCVGRAPSPMAREAEDVVISCIAEHLAATTDSRVADELLSVLEIRANPGCVRALGRIGCVRAIPMLVRCMFEDSTRKAAAEALRCLGPAAIPSVAAVLQETNSAGDPEPPTHIEGRAEAATLLGDLACGSGNGTEIAPADRIFLNERLCGAMNDRQRVVRIAAALAMIKCEHADPLAIQVLVRALDEPDVWQLLSITLALVGSGMKAEPALFDAMTSQDQTEAAVRRRRWAVWIAGELGTPAAAQVLTGMLAKSDPVLRADVISAMARNAATDPRAIEPCLDDSDASVRCRAVVALCRRNSLSEQHATRLLADSDWQIRRLAGGYLQGHRDAARHAVRHAALSLGAPLKGLRNRLRLFWFASLWLLRR